MYIDRDVIKLKELESSPIQNESQRKLYIDRDVIKLKELESSPIQNESEGFVKSYDKHSNEIGATYYNSKFFFSKHM